MHDPGLGRGGDFVCTPSEDGPECLLWTMPEGHGYPIPSPLRLAGLLNDVRGSVMVAMGGDKKPDGKELPEGTGKAPPMKFWQQVPAPSCVL